MRNENKDVQPIATLANNITRDWQRAGAEEALSKILRARIVADLSRRISALDAEDLAHDAIMITLVRLRDGNILEPDKVVAFAVGVARRLLLASFRKTKRFVQNGDEVLRGLLVDEPGPMIDCERKEAHSSLWHRVAQLPVVRDRELLVRYYLYNEDSQSLCSEFGMDPRHLSKVLYRARKRLRSTLVAEGESLEAV